MIINTLVGIMIGLLVIGALYGIYMAIWGVYDEQWQINTINMVEYNDIKYNDMVQYLYQWVLYYFNMGNNNISNSRNNN